MVCLRTTGGGSWVFFDTLLCARGRLPLHRSPYKHLRASTTAARMAFQSTCFTPSPNTMTASQVLATAPDAPDGAGDGRWSLLGRSKVTMKIVCADPTGRLAGVHKVLCNAREIACKGHQDFYLGSDGSFMLPVHSNIGQVLRIYFEKL